jgi:hypothetical protein
MADTGESRIAVVVATLADKDTRIAAEACKALEWIVGGQGLITLTQASIQNFCWYDLPVNWPSDLKGKIGVAEALARALDLLELDRYAAICRSRTTQHILNAYQRSFTSGIAAFRRASAASGVTPPDLPEFEWGAAMGLQESSAWWSVSGLLEVAVMAGDLVPGTRGWRARQREIARTGLTTPRSGQTPVQLITIERTRTWVNKRRSETRADILSGICDRLLRPAQLTAETAADPLPRLRWLLLRMNEGIGLTRTGNLNRAFVQRNADRFGWESSRPPRTENDVADLHRLCRLATRLRLARHCGNAVTLSAGGRRLLDDPGRLWRVTAAGLLWGGDFNVFVGELFLAVVLNGDSAPETDARRLIGKAVAEEGFRERLTHAPPDDHDIARATGQTSGLCRALGLFTDPDRYSFTSAGEATAVQALLARATAPQDIACP